MSWTTVEAEISRTTVEARMSWRTGGVRITSTRGILATLAATVLAALGLTQAARAEGPRWQLESRPAPTYLAPGAPEAQIRVSAINLGDADANPPITITDKLPKGLVATGLVIREGDSISPTTEGCSLAAVSCTWTKTPDTSGEGLPPREEIPPYQRLEMIVTVKVEAGEGAPTTGEDNEVRVQGGNAPSESLSRPITASSAPVPFGVENYEVKPETENGAPAVQAGEHPFQMTTVLNFNQTLGPPEGPFAAHPEVPHLVRDLKLNLPPGLVARARAVSQCSTAQFTEFLEAGQGNLNECPGETAVGVATVNFFTKSLSIHTEEVPVFNLVPQAGEPARFGFEVSNVHVYLDTSVRTGENYGATVSITNASTAVEVLGSVVTIWGVPGNRHHDNSRGWECLDAGRYEGAERGTPVTPCPANEETRQEPFLTLPTVCSSEASARETTVSGDSWPTTEGHGGVVKEEHELEGEADRYLMPALNGCEKLQFKPEEFKVQPDEHAASSPTGLDVTVKFPQGGGILAKEGLAEADIRETIVTLPEGLQPNPGAANGLEKCSVGSAGFKGASGDPGEKLGGELEAQQFSGGPVGCPESSKIGKVSIQTPLLPNRLEGFVYLAEQDTDPFTSPLVLYLIAEDPVSGVLIKLAGEVKISATGRLVSVFRDSPPLPFEELKLELFDGQRASQATPAFCNSYESTASFASWSGGKTAQGSSSFKPESGPNGTACPSGSLPFAPGFQAGTTVTQADAFTPFTLTIGRPDGNQALQSIAMHLPPGLAAMIASVTRCAEPSAGQEWSCGPESLIGHSTASSGLGGDPVTLGGNVYFAGPYEGAPFSLVDITPAKAGPFNLGNVVVRSTIDVDPNTAAATITSDPIPQFVKGVPAQVKQLNVTVERPGFEFNPTNCSPMAITGTLTGYEGASDSVSTPYQVANCASLPFAPVFTASSSAHTSKVDGASLDVKITYPKGAYANVAKSVTELPYALPSRLTTIQKACLDTKFEANPAACDEGSMIGEGIVHTPVFENPLVGPAYLVSHGNRAFPDIEVVLQGEGITLVLDGHTDIKKGITKTTFESVPDAPVEVFELLLPEGPHSALAANDNMCKPAKLGRVREKVAEHSHGHTVHVTKTVTKMVPEALVIPTKLTAQNGRVLEQKTKIAVTGCGAVKASKVKQKPKKSSKKR